MSDAARSGAAPTVFADRPVHRAVAFTAETPAAATQCDPVGAVSPAVGFGVVRGMEFERRI